MNSKIRFNLGIGDRSFGYSRTIIWVQANDGKTAVFSLILYGFIPLLLSHHPLKPYKSESLSTTYPVNLLKRRCVGGVTNVICCPNISRSYPIHVPNMYLTCSAHNSVKSASNVDSGNVILWERLRHSLGAFASFSVF